MAPIKNAPSLGTLHRESTRFFTAAMILSSPFWMLLVILLCPYLVTIRAAWNKEPQRLWRNAVVTSIVVSVILAGAGAIWLFPSGMPIPLPHASYESMNAGMIPKPVIYGLNAMIVAGIPMWPLAFASARHSIRNRRTRRDNPAG